MQIRPEYPRLNYGHGLADGLYFAGLGPSRFVGTTHFHDSSLFGTHGTLTGMDPYSDWVFDPYLGRWVLDFDVEVSEYVSTGLVFGTVFTMAAWIRLSSMSAYRYFLGRNASGGASFGHTSGRKLFSHNVLTGTTVLPLDTWLHVAYTHNGTTGTFWLNGVSDGSANYSVTATSNALFIGNYAATVAYSVDGNVADPCIWNRALSLPEIQTLANPDPWLGGLILPPTRKLWPVAVSVTTGNRRRRLLIAGAYR